MNSKKAPNHINTTKQAQDSLLTFQDFAAAFAELSNEEYAALVDSGQLDPILRYIPGYGTAVQFVPGSQLEN